MLFYPVQSGHAGFLLYHCRKIFAGHTKFVGVETCVAQLNYGNLTGSVHHGGEAMTIYPKIKDMSPEEQQKARQALLDYCLLDTLAMVRIWQKLEEVSR